MSQEKFYETLRQAGLSDEQIAEMEQAYRIQCVLVTMLTYGNEMSVREFDIELLEKAILNKRPDLSQDMEAFAAILEVGLPLSISNDFVHVEESKYSLTVRGKMTAISIMRQQRELEELLANRQSLQERTDESTSP